MSLIVNGKTVPTNTPYVTVINGKTVSLTEVKANNVVIWKYVKPVATPPTGGGHPGVLELLRLVLKDIG